MQVSSSAARRRGAAAGRWRVGQRVEPVGHRAHLRGAVVEQVHARAKRLAAGQGAHRPADVLARAAHAGDLAVQAVVVVQVLEQPGLGLRHVGRRAACSPVARKCAISRKIHGRPCAARPIMIASAPVRGEHLARLRGESMSPLATTGMRTAAFTAAMVSYSACALVALLARAAVHGEHRDAGAPRQRARAHRVALGCAPAGAHLQRHRHAVRRAGGDHRLDDRAAPAARPASAPSRPTCCTPSWPGSPC